MIKNDVRTMLMNFKNEGLIEIKIEYIEFIRFIG